MKAYWVARSKIIDPESYKKYTDLVPDIIQKYSGKILARGGDHEILEGTKEFHRFVIIEFPTIKHGKKCWESEDYQKASSNRKNGSGKVDLILVEAGDKTH
tara:strand:+ start:4603 stop:4905 length:303 start_codon:yes stop_codon:yes gene_type:complete